MWWQLLHQAQPQPLLWSWGPLKLYWYGLLMSLAILLAWQLWSSLGKRQGLSAELQLELALWTVAGGLLGARLYYILLELPYYLTRPLEMLMPWRGGLAIHGALLGGGLALYWAAKWRRQPFWLLAALLTPALAAAQALGRWGNYFNNELYGRETTLPWSIPVFNQAGQVLFYAHPVFLYESLLNAALAFLLWWRLTRATGLATDRRQQQRWLVYYLGAYGLIRFLMEFWRQDHAPELWGWRWPQLLSLGLCLAAVIYLAADRWRRVAKK